MKRRVLAVLAVVALLGVYATGRLDRTLYGIGLNFHECARNGLGATFCGAELDEVRERMRSVSEGLEESKRKLKASDEQSEHERRERESREESERAEAREREEKKLMSKMAAEKAIVEREPEGTAAADLARANYEGDRAELQQLHVER